MQHDAKQSPGFPMFSCAGAEELEDCIAIESTAFGGAHEDEDEPSRPLTFEQDVTRTVAQALLDRFESDDEEEEREEGHVDEEVHVPEPSVIGQSAKSHSPVRHIHH